jgi:flagellar hook assembly protein FlgD
MDVGALAGVPLSGGWALRAGAALADAFSSLAWSSGLEELQPSVLRLGLALEGRPAWWLAFQQDHLDRQGGGASNQWRVGFQTAFFNQALHLRGGATQAQGAGLYYSGGMGVEWSWLDGRLGLDYAILVPGDGHPGSFLRQGVELRWSRRPGRGEPAAGLRNLIQDNGKIRHARIALAEGPVDTAAWELRLRDRRGRVVKTLKGRGALPPSLSWDGRDETGELVDAGGLGYELRTTSASGRTTRRSSLLEPTSAALGGVDQALAEVEPGLELRASPGSSAPVRAKPRLRGGGGLTVAGADFDLSGLQGSSAEGEWSLRIRDESGRTVKEIRGRGRIPKKLRWEGKDELGNPVDPGLGATFELRVTDATGKETVAEDDLVRGEGLLEARRSNLASEGLRWEAAEMETRAAAPCRIVAGEVLCHFEFEPASSRLGPEARVIFEEAAFLSAGQGSLRLRVDGFAAEDEPEPRALSQARADAVLRRLVEGGGFNYRDIEAVGHGAIRGPGARSVKLSISRRP